VSSNNAGTITWTSSNSNIATATIAQNGTITFTPGTQPGVATITFTAAATSTHTAATATFTIEVTNGSLTVQEHSYSGVYDTQPHSATVSCSTSGVTITYSESQNGTYSATAPTKTDVGTYNVYYKVEKAGYTTQTGKITISITLSQTATVSGDGSSHDFTGSPITGITGENIEIVSGVASATNANSYTVTVKPKANYAWADDGTTNERTLNWEIKDPAFKVGDYVLADGCKKFSSSGDAIKNQNDIGTFNIGSGAGKWNDFRYMYIIGFANGSKWNYNAHIAGEANTYAAALSKEVDGSTTAWARLDEIKHTN
jgi:hypothetical protein